MGYVISCIHTESHTTRKEKTKVVTLILYLTLAAMVADRGSGTSRIVGRLVEVVLACSPAGTTEVGR